VETFVWWRDGPHPQPRAVRASRGRRARLEDDRHAPVEVRVDAAALEAAGRRVGWRVDGTHQPREPLSLAPAVLA